MKWPRKSAVAFLILASASLVEAQILQTLCSFNSTNGANSFAALTLGPDGSFFGTTYSGGSNNYGTVFKVTTNGSLTTLATFNSTNGANPNGSLTLGPDGSFYGTTSGGGITNSTYSVGMGTVFKVTTNGSLTTVVAFNMTNGVWPGGPLTLETDGSFYGTTPNGGSNNYGTVFRLSCQPLITVQPESQTNNNGATVTFLVSAVVFYPVGYQWQKNGTNLVNGGNILGATSNILTVTDIADSDAASYSVIVSNSYAAATSSNAVLTVNDSPLIVLQPQSQTVGVGSNVTFDVTVYGAPPFVFQWYFNEALVGSPGVGAHFLSCTLTNVGTNQAGNYSVEVINGYGTVKSSNAVLTVEVFPPLITVQPLSQTLMMGSSASFVVSVSGTPPFSYQWQFNGTNLLNATNAVYAIQAVGVTDTGNYSVVVTNLVGSVTSSNALLTVIVPPTMALQLLAGYPVLNLEGMLSSNFVVQYSTNLAGTNWMNLLSLTNLPSSPYQFLDSGGVGQPSRFYRAFMQ